MPTETPNSDNPSWEIVGNSIRIFGAWGEDLGTGWEVGEVDSIMSWRIHPNKASIRLKSSIENGRLSIKSADAVLLFLEGKITEEALNASGRTGSNIQMELTFDDEVVLLTIERS